MRAVPMRVGEMSTRVQDLRLRFHAAPTMYQPKPEVRLQPCLPPCPGRLVVWLAEFGPPPPQIMEEHLKDVLQVSAQKYAKMEPHSDLQAMQSGQAVHCPPPSCIRVQL